MSLVPQIYPYKKYCRRPSCDQTEMVLIRSENWHICPVCTDVQPITYDKPLFWLRCSYCRYPRIITKEENNTPNLALTCHKCMKIFIKG